jgi:hypothetical protein
MKISFLGFSGMELASRLTGMAVGGLNGYVLYDYAGQRSSISISSILAFMCCGFLKPTSTLLVSGAAIGVVRNIHRDSNRTQSMISINYKQV